MDGKSDHVGPERRRALDSPIFCQSSGIDWDLAKVRMQKRMRKSDTMPSSGTVGAMKQVQLISFFGSKQDAGAEPAGEEVCVYLVARKEDIYNL